MAYIFYLTLSCLTLVSSIQFLTLLTLSLSPSLSILFYLYRRSLTHTLFHHAPTFTIHLPVSPIRSYLSQLHSPPSLTSSFHSSPFKQTFNTPSFLFIHNAFYFLQRPFLSIVPHCSPFLHSSTCTH